MRTFGAMARPSFHGLFLRLPPPAAFLVLASILGAADSHALPRQTKTVALHELNVVAWPLLPTEAPVLPHELLFRRQDNTVCGYIGGDLDFPATCGVGSHCVLDTDNKIVGCCPNGGSCSTGVFTGCVDGNSSPQTEVNPYVYTCQGSDVCYQNAYAGGYSQYGCGSTDLATSVQTSVDGITTSLDLPQSSVGLTATPTSLSEPTTIGSGTRSSATTGSSSSRSDTASTRSTSTDSASVTSDSSSTPTSSATSSSTSSGVPTEAPGTDGDSGSNRTGAIVGGTLGAIAGLFVLAGLAFFLLRRRQNPRQGPGPAPPAPPTTEFSSPIRSHGAAFAPLPSRQDEQSNSYGNSHNTPYDQQDLADDHSYSTVPVVPPPQRYDPAHVAGVGTGLAPVDEEDARTHGQSRELDLSRAYSDAPIGLSSDDDTRPLTAPDDLTHPRGSTSSYYAEPPPNPGPIRGGNRPLWQQNRI